MSVTIPSYAELRELGKKILVREAAHGELVVSSVRHNCLHSYLPFAKKSRKRKLKEVAECPVEGGDEKEKEKAYHLLVIECTASSKSRKHFLNLQQLADCFYQFLLECVYFKRGQEFTLFEQLPLWFWHGLKSIWKPDKRSENESTWIYNTFPHLNFWPKHTEAAGLHPERYYYYRKLLINPELPAAQDRKSKSQSKLPWWRNIILTLEDLALSTRSFVKTIAEDELEPSAEARNGWTYRVLNLLEEAYFLNLEGLSGEVFHVYDDTDWNSLSFEYDEVRKSISSSQKEKKVRVDNFSLSAALYSVCWKLVERLEVAGDCPLKFWNTDSSITGAETLYESALWWIQYGYEGTTPLPEFGGGSRFLQQQCIRWNLAQRIANAFLEVIFGGKCLLGSHKIDLASSSSSLDDILDVLEGQGQQGSELDLESAMDTLLVDIVGTVEDTILQLRDFSRMLNRFHRRANSLSTGSVSFVRHTLFKLQLPVPTVQKLMETAVYYGYNSTLATIQNTLGNIRVCQGEGVEPCVLCFERNSRELVAVNQLHLYCGLRYYSRQYGVPTPNCFCVVHFPDQDDQLLYVVLSSTDLYHLQFGLTPFLCVDRSLSRSHAMPLYPRIVDNLILGDDVNAYFALCALHHLIVGGRTAVAKRSESVFPQPDTADLPLVRQLLISLPARFYPGLTQVYRDVIQPLEDVIHLKHTEREGKGITSSTVLSGRRASLYRSLISLLEWKRPDHYVEETAVELLHILFTADRFLRLKYWKTALVVKLLSQKIYNQSWVLEESMKDKPERLKGRPLATASLLQRRVQLPGEFKVYAGAVFRVVSDEFWALDTASCRNPLRPEKDTVEEDESVTGIMGGEYGRYDTPAAALTACHLSEELVEEMVRSDPFLSSEPNQVETAVYPLRELYLFCAAKECPVETAQTLFESIVVGNGDVPISTRALGGGKSLGHIRHCTHVGWLDCYLQRPLPTAALPTLPEYSLAHEPTLPGKPVKLQQMDPRSRSWVLRNYEKTSREGRQLYRKYLRTCSLLPLARDLEEILYKCLSHQETYWDTSNSYLSLLYGDVKAENELRAETLSSYLNKEEEEGGKQVQRLTDLVSELERAAFYPFEKPGGSRNTHSSNSSRKRGHDRRHLPPPGKDSWPHWPTALFLEKKRDYPLTLDGSGSSRPLYPLEVLPIPLCALLLDSDDRTGRNTEKVLPQFGELLPFAGSAPRLLETVLLKPISANSLRQAVAYFTESRGGDGKGENRAP